MSGEPDQYGVIGHPVSHSWSPFIHGLFARQTGQSMSYRLYDAPPGRFRSCALEFFAGGGLGLNVTVPHKAAAAELANELTPRAERAGAVNTLALQGITACSATIPTARASCATCAATSGSSSSPAGCSSSVLEVRRAACSHHCSHSSRRRS